MSFNDMKDKMDEAKKKKKKAPKKAKKKKKVVPKKAAAPKKVVAKISVTDLLVRVDTGKLYPPFKKKLNEALVKCRKKGSDYFVLSGLRTWMEQEKLYQIGRDVTGRKIGRVVTNAKAGRSAHNYGVAADGCKDKMPRAGLQPDWNVKEYKCWAECAEEVGLEAGYNWSRFRDAPHIQLPLKKHGFTWDKLSNLHLRGGLPRVWKELDKHNWDGKCLECD
jgi:peptidoglycan L-alanyl-D-glutamate endopeptidase CwlK